MLYVFIFFMFYSLFSLCFFLFYSFFFFFFFFNDPATTEIYTLSLHDALPIFGGRAPRRRALRAPGGRQDRPPRSEEHTSELQSRFDLVCRLLLEKKKKKKTTKTEIKKQNHE